MYLHLDISLYILHMMNVRFSLDLVSILMVIQYKISKYTILDNLYIYLKLSLYIANNCNKLL